MAIVEHIKKIWKHTPAACEIPPAIVEQYNQARHTAYKQNLCNAPFNNMYFNVLGQVGPCWLSYLGGDTWPEKSIHQIWFGERFNALRNQIKQSDLTGQCITCKNNIEAGNYVSALSVAYDVVPVKKYPAMMEFELNNTCNLECVMCKGELSSSIRKNRDKLPAIKSPYNPHFVEQLKEFIPHLTEARFNGGEPFLITIYYSIWEEILRLNPACKITIATNGSVLNYKVKDILERGNFLINLSLDGITQESYETIRVNGHFGRVMENLHWFAEYCQRKQTILCLMVNPMRQNWHEMPQFVRLCNRLHIPVWFNTVDYPSDQSLSHWNFHNLQKAYEALSKETFENTTQTPPHLFERNSGIYRNFVFVQLHHWLQQAQTREAAAQNIPLPRENEIDFLFTEEAPPAGAEQKKFFVHQYHTLLTEYRLTKTEAQQQLKQIQQAAQRVYEHSRSRITPEGFFELLNRYPPKIIIETLTTQNTQWVAEKIEALV